MPRGTAVQHNQPWIELDFRHVLPAVQVPTLVIERRRDLPHGRHLAGLIPGSEYVLLEGEPQLPWVPGGSGRRPRSSASSQPSRMKFSSRPRSRTSRRIRAQLHERGEHDLKGVP
jgi:hypothetical protein